MRILLYNWTPLQHPKVGGGVAVYMQNILQYLTMHQNNDVDIVFLSSGFYYDSANKEIYIRKEKEFLSVENYTIVNSPVIAPLGYASSSLERATKDTKLKDVLDKFIQEHGPFDVIHFHSFEGISTNVLQLKKKYPSIRFIHSTHDYGILCPNVRLWNNKNENCLTSQCKYQCNTCVSNTAPFLIHVVSLANQRSYEYHVSPVTWFWVRVLKHLKKISYRYFRIPNSIYSNYRATNVANINRYSDGEICVSKRVAEILKTNGVAPEKIIVDYIGTKVAEVAKYKCRNNPHSTYFTILYMGYAVIEKGFFAYLHSLEQISAEDAKCINLKFATRISDVNIKKRLEALNEKFNSVQIIDGYTHDDFPQILDQVNLGVVPPLWEDNLPQVSIEMVANGIPVITTLNGGAQELNEHAAFKCTDDLSEKIINIKNNRYLLEEYWSSANQLTTMEKHIQNLLAIWKNS